MTSNPQERMAELSQRFTQLEPKLEDSPDKEALSILHAMIQEGRREMLTSSDNTLQDPVLSFDKVANLY
jgi:hypothetical protein